MADDSKVHMLTTTDNKVHMLTTTDNPFNPFTQFDEWLSFDTAAGYNTLGYLARLARSSDELSDADQRLATEQAISEIELNDVTNTYVRVSAPES